MDGVEKLRKALEKKAAFFQVEKQETSGCVKRAARFYFAYSPALGASMTSWWQQFVCG